IPPHSDVRMIDEYGLSSVTWQPVDSSSASTSPGANEQCRSCTWRSRCCTKSRVETLANATPASAASNRPTPKMRVHMEGILGPAGAAHHGCSTTVRVGCRERQGVYRRCAGAGVLEPRTVRPSGRAGVACTLAIFVRIGAWLGALFEVSRGEG